MHFIVQKYMYTYVQLDMCLLILIQGSSEAPGVSLRVQSSEHDDSGRAGAAIHRKRASQRHQLRLEQIQPTVDAGSLTLHVHVIVYVGIYIKNSRQNIKCS